MGRVGVCGNAWTHTCTQISIMLQSGAEWSIAAEQEKISTTFDSLYPFNWSTEHSCISSIHSPLLMAVKYLGGHCQRYNCEGVTLRYQQQKVEKSERQHMRKFKRIVDYEFFVWSMANLWRCDNVSVLSNLREWKPQNCTHIYFMTTASSWCECYLCSKKMVHWVS